MSLKRLFSGWKKEKKVLQGKRTKDKSYCSENTFQDIKTAREEFKRSVDKLFNINNWSNLPGVTSKFILYSKIGSPKTTILPENGDYIKILLPGPAPANWVKITEIVNEKHSAEFTVSPSQDPTAKKQDEKEIEHFFIDEATSTFLVELKGSTIKACEVGRDEGINNDRTAGDREVINTILAEGGWAVFQKIQWKKLTDYLVHKTEVKPSHKSKDD